MLGNVRVKGSFFSSFYLAFHCLHFVTNKMVWVQAVEDFNSAIYSALGFQLTLEDVPCSVQEFTSSLGRDRTSSGGWDGTVAL